MIKQFYIQHEINKYALTNYDAKKIIDIEKCQDDLRIIKFHTCIFNIGLCGWNNYKIHLWFLILLKLNQDIIKSE
jgi:hypothetical protein